MPIMSARTYTSVHIGAVGQEQNDSCTLGDLLQLLLLLLLLHWRWGRLLIRPGPATVHFRLVGRGIQLFGGDLQWQGLAAGDVIKCKSQCM